MIDPLQCAFNFKEPCISLSTSWNFLGFYKKSNAFVKKISVQFEGRVQVYKIAFVEEVKKDTSIKEETESMA